MLRYKRHQVKQEREWQDYMTARVQWASIRPHWRPTTASERAPRTTDFLVLGSRPVEHEQTPEEMLAVAEAWVAVYGGQIVD